jgi:hypothetical protein
LRRGRTGVRKIQSWLKVGGGYLHLKDAAHERRAEVCW